jgi:hypothetical protein
MSDDEQPPEQEQSLNPQTLPSLENTLRAIHEANRTAFQKEIDQAGGPRQWLASVPRVLEIVQSSTPREPSDSAYNYLLQLETKAFWTGIETRLGECARCPPEGGACDGPARDRLNEGIFVRLEVLPSGPREHPKLCARYQEFRLARRLEKGGVVHLLSRTVLEEITPELKDEVIVAFNTCIAKGIGKPAPMDFDLIIEGTRARQYGAAFLRGILLAYGSCGFQSVSVEAFARQWKNAYTVRKDNPLLMGLEDVQVLVLDGINASFLTSEKRSLKEFQWLASARRDAGLCTIITSLCPAKEAFPGVSVLRV